MHAQCQGHKVLNELGLGTADGLVNSRFWWSELGMLVERTIGILIEPPGVLYIKTRDSNWCRIKQIGAPAPGLLVILDYSGLISSVCGAVCCALVLSRLRSNT